MCAINCTPFVHGIQMHKAHMFYLWKHLRKTLQGVGMFNKCTEVEILVFRTRHRLNLNKLTWLFLGLQLSSKSSFTLWVSVQSLHLCNMSVSYLEHICPGFEPLTSLWENALLCYFKFIYWIYWLNILTKKRIEDIFIICPLSILVLYFLHWTCFCRQETEQIFL